MQAFRKNSNFFSSNSRVLSGQLCQFFELDPLGVIASGALLIALSEADVEPVCRALQDAEIPVAPIARAMPASYGLVLHTADGTAPLPRFDQDEIARLF